MSFSAEVLERLEAYGRRELSRPRFGHVTRVAMVARSFAYRFGADPQAAWVAGMAHDLAREWSDEKLLAFARLPQFPALDLEIQKPVLLHGIAAARLLIEEFHITDYPILEAVRHHTLGAPGMGQLALILFAADYLEPGRKFTTLRFRRSVRELSLPDLVCACIEHNVKRGKSSAPPTEALLAALSSNRQSGIVG